MSSTRIRRPGFTLVELLVVIGIIALLIGILLPTLSRARESAKSIADLSNQRQIALGLIGYSTDFDGKLPAGQYRHNAPGVQPNIASGTPRDIQEWTHAVSGYLNSDRENGYSLPWTGDAVTRTNPDDNYHPALYCPSADVAFVNMTSHYTVNNVLMPHMYWDRSSGFPAGGYVKGTKDSLRLSTAFPDNFLTHDAALTLFATSTVDRRNGIYNWPSPALNLSDWGIMVVADVLATPDVAYRNEAGESAAVQADAFLTIAQPVIVPGVDFGTEFKPNADIITAANVFYLELGGLRFRHGAEDKSNMSFADGSGRSMSLFTSRGHVASPTQFWTSEVKREHYRTKTPSRLPKQGP